jgi:RNA polymerase sigma factor (sigma-70 family)
VAESIVLVPSGQTQKRQEWCILASRSNASRLMAESSERLLIESLPLLEQIIESLCTRKGMSADEVEEFAAEVKLRLIVNDYAALKAYANRSTFKTYLTAVVSRFLLDYRNQQWGKWRTSANAQHLGPIAVDLERLLHRDKVSFDEAFAVLARQHPSLTRNELRAIADRLQPRTGRKNVSIDEAVPIAAPSAGIDVESADTASRISEVVRGYLDALPREDQVVFRLRFVSDMTGREIATALHLDQQKVFRRLYRHCEALRKRLLSAGVDAVDVERLIGADTALLDFDLKSRGARPSDEEESAVDVRQEDISS